MQFEQIKHIKTYWNPNQSKKHKAMESLSSYLQHALKEHEIVESIAKAFSAKPEFSCIVDYLYPNSGKRADVMLLYNKKPYACIEVKTSLQSDRALDGGEKQLESGRDILLLRFGILTDGKETILYDWWQDPEKQKTKWGKLAQVAEKLYQAKDETILQISINRLNNIKKNFCDLFNKLFPEKKISVNQIEFGDGTSLKLNKDIERAFFDSLFPPFLGSEVCRFTTLGSIFATIDKRSFRMLATEGMNDIEDGTFLWKKLYGEKDQEKALPKNREPIFILSCSPIDSALDLTMWRLYADDTKGVCLEFVTDNVEHYDGFYLREVQYDGENNVIERLKLLIQGFGEATGYTFVFNYWELWSAFVKSKEYKVEKEIRLAYIPSLVDTKKPTKQWLITDSNKIVSEYIDFKEEFLYIFPLQLKKVWLGASCPEKKVNEIQLKKMIESTKEFKGKNIEVEVSKIDNYRPSK